MLDPVPGYVVKTTTLVGNKQKIFINICVDPQVPTPETMDIAAITARVMAGEDWVVPIVVGPEKSVSDKAGNPAKVFCCCLNPQILHLGVQDPGIKVLVNETCIELVEDASGYELDRNYTIPKMKQKGELDRMELGVSTPRTLEERVASVGVGANAPRSAPASAPSAPASAPSAPRSAPAPPKIEILEDRPTVHPYTRKWGGSDTPPRLEIRIPGKHPVKIDKEILIGPHRVNAGTVIKAEAVYTSQDDGLHVFVW